MIGYYRFKFEAVGGGVLEMWIFSNPQKLLVFERLIKKSLMFHCVIIQFCNF